jgi:hypothetical protein
MALRHCRSASTLQQRTGHSGPRNPSRSSIVHGTETTIPVSVHAGFSCQQERERMKLLPILAAAAAATLAVPAATAVAAPAAPAASAKVDIQHGRHYRKRAYWRTVCTTKWRHGHRQRVCRKVRYWR